MERHGEMRKKERDLFPAPVLDKKGFPPVNPEIFEKMEAESQHLYNVFNRCFAYVRDGEDGWFVDVYYYYREDGEKKPRCVRFVIAPGYVMDAEEEERFIKYTAVYFFTRCSNEILDGVVEAINRKAPQLQVKKYDCIGKVLQHIYFTSHRSGIRELLWKAGLDEIALDLASMEEVDISAAGVEEAFDGIPIKMLRKLNFPGMEAPLKRKYRRIRTSEIYRKYHSTLTDMIQINPYQWNYLEDCLQNGLPFPDKRDLKELAKIGPYPMEHDLVWGKDIYSMYQKYKEQIGRDKKYTQLFPRYPSLDNMHDFCNLYRNVQTYVKHEQEIEDGVAKQVALWEKKYIYEQERFFLFMPGCTKDIIRECGCTHGCLHLYLLSYAEGTSLILSVREKEPPKEPVIALKVEKGCLSSIWRRGYEVTEELAGFVRKFAKENGLECDIEVTDTSENRKARLAQWLLSPEIFQ